MLATLDALIHSMIASLSGMAYLLGQNVTILTAIGNAIPSAQTMPLSTAAFSGFVMPWVNNLGPIIHALTNFLGAL